MIVLQTFLGFQQRTGDYNLVEQVPLATIEQCSHTFIFKGFPPGIIEFAFFHLLRILACTQCRHAFVHRIVVHISHDYQLQFLVRTHQGVCQCPYLLGCMYTHRRLSSTGRPVINDETNAFTCHLSVYNKEATRQVHSVSLKRSGKHQFGIGDGELFRIIKQCAINAPFIRAFIMHEFIVGYSRLTYQICQYPVVFSFGYTDNGGSFRYTVARYFTQDFGKVLQLGLILLSRPYITAGRQKIKVVLTCIMNRIKQVLKIIKRNTIQIPFVLLGSCRSDAEP